MGSLNVATGKAHYLRNNYDHLERGNWQGQYLRSNYGHIKFGELQAQYLRNNYGHLERGNWQGQYLRSNYGQLERGNGQGQYLRSPSSSDYGNHASIRAGSVGVANSMQYLVLLPGLALVHRGELFTQSRTHVTCNDEARAERDPKRYLNDTKNFACRHYTIIPGPKFALAAISW